jgi:hypothetical protein
MSPPPAPSILDRGVIYDATQQPLARRAAFFTSIYQVPSSGIWLSAFQVGTVKHAPDSTIQLARSRDQGKNWALINFNFATQLNGILGSLSPPSTRLLPENYCSSPRGSIAANRPALCLIRSPKEFYLRGNSLQNPWMTAPPGVTGAFCPRRD